MADNCKLVAELDSECAEELGCTAPARNNTIDVNLVGAIGEGEVAVSLEVELGVRLGALGNSAADSVPSLTVVSESLEGSEVDILNVDTVLQRNVLHLRIVVMGGLRADNGDNVAFLDAGVGKIVGAIYIYLAAVIPDVEVAVLGVGHLADIAGDAVLGVSVGSSIDLCCSCLDDGALLAEGSDCSVLLAGLGGLEAELGAAVAACIFSDIERNDGAGAADIHSGNGNPGLVLLRDNHFHTVTLGGEGYGKDTALDREFGSLRIDGLDLDEGLLDCEYGCVHKLRGALVAAPRAFYHNDVAYLYAVLAELLLRTLVESSVDVNRTGFVSHVHIAVGSVLYGGDGALDLEGRAVFRSVHLCTGGDRKLNLLGHLEHGEKLGLAGAQELEHAFVGSGSGFGGEGYHGLARYARRRSDGEPFRNVGNLPGVGGSDCHVNAATLRRKGYIGL